MMLLNSNYQLIPLNKHPEWLSALVEQQWQAWGYDDPEDLADFYAQSLSNPLPKVWILLDTAHSSPELVGSVALSLDEMGDCQPSSRNPWLGYLYIEPAYRGQGLAKALTQFATQQVQQLGYSSVYLYASDEMPRYLKWGWQPLETFEFQQETVTVMQFLLAKNQAN